MWPCHQAQKTQLNQAKPQRPFISSRLKYGKQDVWGKLPSKPAPHHCAWCSPQGLGWGGGGGASCPESMSLRQMGQEVLRWSSHLREGGRA